MDEETSVSRLVSWTEPRTTTTDFEIAVETDADEGRTILEKFEDHERGTLMRSYLGAGRGSRCRSDAVYRC